MRKKTASATHSTGKMGILRILRKNLRVNICSNNTGNTKIGSINIGDNSSFQQNVYCSEKLLPSVTPTALNCDWKDLLD